MFRYLILTLLLSAMIISCSGSKSDARVALENYLNSMKNEKFQEAYDNLSQNVSEKCKFEEFQKISPITGIIMTKLDGTAKGGILVAIGKKFKIPIVAIGLGEKEDDLQIFSAKNFAQALIKN